MVAVTYDSLDEYDNLYVISHKAKINPTVRLEPFIVIDENVKIGKGTLIGPFTQIRSNTVIGENCNIGGHCTFEGDIKVGDNTRIGTHSTIAWNTKIGNNCFIGNYFSNANDKEMKWPNKDGFIPSPTVIKDNVKIGLKVTTLPNITIGKNSVIGAGSLITKDVKPYNIVYGTGAIVRGICNE